MVAARERWLFLGLLFGACVMSGEAGLKRANELVASYGRHAGVDGVRLGRDNACSVGAVGFQYDDESGVLVVRAFVTPAKIQRFPKEQRANFRRMEEALKDPEIGGMFETDGALWELNEESEAYYLRKDFSVAETDERELRREVDELQNIAATWTIHWFSRVALIMHGHEDPPAAPVTRENDPRVRR